MDSKGNQLACLEELLSSARDEFLVSLSNKGTVNRGKKDLEKLRKEIAVSEEKPDCVQITLGDDVTVTLAGRIPDCACTCPASGLCRHMVTAICYVKEIYENSGGGEPLAGEEVFTSENYPELNSLTPEMLRKMAGKREYGVMAASLRMTNTVAFTYGRMLRAEFTDHTATVYFPMVDSVEKSVCSCREEGVCRHKCRALAAYLMYERGVELAQEEEAELGERERAFLERTRRELAGWMERGIAGLSDEVVRETQQSYIRAYGLKFFRMADEYKWLSADFADYFSKNVAFSNTAALHRICRLHNLASALLGPAAAGRRAYLMGKRREESHKLSGLKLWGLGAAVRMTKRRELLLSAYFYSPDLKEYLILSTLRPTEGRVPELVNYLWNAGVFWSMEASMRSVCEQKLVMNEAVITKGRISGTKNTEAKTEGMTAEEELEQIAVGSAAELREKLEKKGYQYFDSYSEAGGIFLLKVEEIRKAEYDPVGQRCRAEAVDRNAETVALTIQYDESSKKAIAWLEQRKSSARTAYVLGNFRLRDGGVTGTLLNLFEDGRGLLPYF